MKHIKLTFITTILLFSFVFAQEGWVQLPFGGNYIHFKSVKFLDENLGWIASSSSLSGIYKTTDGGMNWEQKLLASSFWESLVCIDFDTVLVVGSNGAIAKTINGGEDWTFPQSGTSSWLRSIFFIDSNTGWISGEEGTILKTTDGGDDWISQSGGTPPLPLVSVYFINQQIGWIVGSDGTIIKTTDGGDNWISQISNTDEVLTSVQFIDQNLGWIVGFNGIILTTTNGGTNWELQLSGTTEWLYSLYFVDSKYGWIAGSTGIILHSSDGGMNWTFQTSNTVNHLNSIYFLDSLTGWIAGSYTTILKTTDGGVSFVEEEELNELTTEYYLSNNYPNPFNPSTKIRYSLPQTSEVVIKIFDVLGNEIETLVDEEKPAGTYELTWYAVGITSGVYFYQLRVNAPSSSSGQAFIETKKMLLIK